MTDKKVWLITGAGRGLGLDIVKAALAAGHAVIATGRDPAKVTAAIGHHDELLAIKLDVTHIEDAYTAVAAAVTKFGRIDVVVNNAGNFYAGFFEGPTPVGDHPEMPASKRPFTVCGKLNQCVAATTRQQACK
jgi:NAD(P)-dependent dehydrogenase (short-subunit alcohol dehydrogenase family)